VGSKISEYLSESIYIRDKARRELWRVQWIYDPKTKLLYVFAPSSKKDKYYEIIIHRTGQVEKLCECPASRQGKKCWHMHAAAVIYNKVNEHTYTEPVYGKGDRERFTGEDAYRALDELEKQTDSYVDLSRISPTLKTLLDFVEGFL